MTEKKRATKTPGNPWGVTGHDDIVAMLSRHIADNTLAHAMCFSGPEHVGKYLTALRMAQAFHCTASSRPCRTCTSCRSVERGTHPDCIAVGNGEEKGTIGVETIRSSIILPLQQTSVDGWKVAIIDEADRMTTEAANSLLKTLEEPTPRTVIVLIAHRAHLLLPTIRSRCAHVRFRRVLRADILAMLIAHGGAASSRERIADASDGRPGTALHYLHHPETFSVFRERTEHFLEMIGDPSVAQRLVGSDATAKSVAKESTTAVEDLFHVWISCTRDLLYERCGRHDAIRNTFASRRIRTVAATRSTREWGIVLGTILQTREQLRAHIQPRAAFDMIVLPDV